MYLVSLEQDVARREALEKRFPKYYSEFIHIKAVDGRKLPAKEYYDATLNFFHKHKRPMSPAELGCTLSHIKALESFLSTSAPFALILEDDVLGNDTNLEQLEGKINQLEESSLLLCGGQEGLNLRYQLGKADNTTETYKVAKFSYAFIFRTCCYVVSRKSARQILAYHNQGITLADKWNEFFKNTSMKIYYTSILKHPEDLTESHIEADRRSQDKTFLQKLFSVDGPRKVFNRIYFNVMTTALKIVGYKQL